VAAYNGNVAAVALLIERGALVLARNDRGETPVDLAFRYGHAAVAGLLSRFLPAFPAPPAAAA